jgi:hypothetical protein
MRKIILLLVLLAPITLLAQRSYWLPGYIVDPKGDTVKGYIRNVNPGEYHFSGDVVSFKETEKGKIDEYGPLQVQSFQVGTDRYVSKDADGKLGLTYEKDNTGERHFSFKRTARRFLRVVIAGDMNLYEFEVVEGAVAVQLGAGTFHRPGTASVYTFKFLQRNSEDTLFNVQGDDLKKRMIDYFRTDAGDIAVKIYHEDYTKHNLAEYVKAYNLLKYVPTPPRSRRTSAVVFYKRLNNRSAGLTLTINDTITYAIPEKYIGMINIPVDTRTKVCYGSETVKVCDLLTGIPFYPLPEYYELHANGGKDKLDIEKKESGEAQRNLVQVRTQKY